jgi:SAM-dependent methyltransferase
MTELRRLNERDVLAYDFRPEVYSPIEQSYRGELTSEMVRSIRDAFGPRPYTFLDVGGGSGVLSDYLLGRFHESRGVLIDTSAELLARNRPDPRKVVFTLSAEDLASRFPPRSFDLVCCHCLLHHIVDGGYSSSGKRVEGILVSLRTLLKPGGYLSVLEHCYDGRVVDALPGWLIFQATSSRYLTRVCVRMGARTAGVGVRFLSQRQWRSVFASCGFDVERCDLNPPKVLPWFVRRAMCIRSAHVVHFWCGVRKGADT